MISPVQSPRRRRSRLARCTRHFLILLLSQLEEFPRPRPLELWLFFLFPPYSTLFLIKGYFYTYSIAVFRQFVKSSEGYSNEILSNFPARGKQKTRKQLRVRYEKGSPPRGSDPG